MKTKEESEIETLIENLLKQRPDLTKPAIQKLIKEKKQTMDKKLGRGAINDQGALFIIAQDLGVPLSESSPLFDSSKSDFERYLDYRDSTRESCLFILDKLNEKIFKLIEQIKSEDTDVYNKLNEAYKFLTNIIIPSLFKDDEDWKRPKDLDSLNNMDTPIFLSIPESLRQFFNKTYLAFLENSANVNLSDARGLFRLHQKFENENSYLRYPDGVKNPYFNASKAATLKNQGKKYEWVMEYEAADEFLQCFNGVVSLIDSMRNFEIHNNDPNTRSKFNMTNRKILDPLTGMSNPGNFIIIANLCVNCAYQFFELLQIWIDSKTIQRKRLAELKKSP